MKKNVLPFGGIKIEDCCSLCLIGATASGQKSHFPLQQDNPNAGPQITGLLPGKRRLVSVNDGLLFGLGVSVYKEKPNFIFIE